MADTELEIEVDDETYEVKAIKAYIRGELKAKDLQASLDVSRATAHRMVARYKKEGAEGLISKKVGNKNRSFSNHFRSHVMVIVRDSYADFGPTLAAEKLQDLHEIQISVEKLRQWMIEENLWTDRQGRQPRIFSPRDPRPQRGELIQVDGSYHRWFEKRGGECCLIVFIDDATSELKLLRFVEHETSYNYMNCLMIYIQRFGRPQALFADRHSIFRATNPKADGVRTPTQFARACGKLEIQIICAKTPQAKGRVERANRTLQDRLIKEMRLANISTMEEGNKFLEKYRLDHNERFAREPRDPADAYRPAPNADLKALLTYAVERKVFKDLSLSYNKLKIILDDCPLARKAVGSKVSVVQTLQGDLDVLYDEQSIPFRIFDKIRRVRDVPEVVDHKRLGAALALSKTISDAEPHHYKRNAHVLAGFRKHFRNPTDPESTRLKNPPKELRRANNGRPRAPLGRHPIVICSTSLASNQKKFDKP